MAAIVHQFLPNGQVRENAVTNGVCVVPMLASFLKIPYISFYILMCCHSYCSNRTVVRQHTYNIIIVLFDLSLSFLKLLFMNHKLVKQYEKQLDSTLTGKH